MVDTISMASGTDPIELGVRAAQQRCLTNIPEFTTDDEDLLYAVKTIRKAVDTIRKVVNTPRESQVSLTDLSPHSVAFFAEVAGVAIFARQHFNDEPISPDDLRSICKHLLYVWNSFTHYG